MRACKSLGKRPVAGTLAVCVLAFGASAFGPVMEWVPVSSTGPAIISGNDITIEAGGVQVQFDIFIGGWALAPSAPDLGGYQGTAVGSDMLGANASPANPGVDLSHTAQLPCASDSDCPSGLCGSFEFGFCNDNQPGFQRSFVCLNDSTQPCSRAAQCAIACIPNPDFIVTGCGASLAVPLLPNNNYEFIAACSSSIVDPGVPRYAGSIRFGVPSNPRGTYTITFNSDTERTFLNDQDGVLIPGLTRIPGTITIESGCCCFGMGSGQPNCISNVLRSECDARPAPRLFEPGDSVVCCVSDDVGGTVCADDCDGDGILNVDETLLAQQDCNDNGMCNRDEIRSCPVWNPLCADCNTNGLPDSCDVASGTSADCDSDGLPDECTVKGDLNDDGVINIEDALQFVECLDGPELATSAACQPADFDSDCDVDLEDVAAFSAAF